MDLFRILARGLPLYRWVLLAALAWSSSAAATDEGVHKFKLPATASKLEAFVPEGWGIEKTLHGDLTNDGREETVLLLHQNDTDNIILGPENSTALLLDTNPRALIGLMTEDDNAKSYRLIFQSTELIPRRDSAQLDEPLSDVRIEDGLLVVELHFWISTGAWPGSETVFRFKKEDSCLRLVNYENTETQRNSKEVSGQSVNYLDGFSENVKSRAKGGFKVQRLPLKEKAVVCIEQMGNGWDFDPPGVAPMTGKQQ
jgi:hypothetical protein